jgi:hypothetical protein
VAGAMTVPSSSVAATTLHLIAGAEMSSYLASTGPSNIALQLIVTPACTRLRRGNPSRQQLNATLDGPMGLFCSPCKLTS